MTARSAKESEGKKPLQDTTTGNAIPTKAPKFVAEIIWLKRNLRKQRRLVLAAAVIVLVSWLTPWETVRQTIVNGVGTLSEWAFASRGNINGVVHYDGNPVGSIEVLLSDRTCFSDETESLRTATGASGTYAFEDLLPGKYFIWTAGGRDARGWADLRSRCSTVTVAEDGISATEDLSLYRSLNVRTPTERFIYAPPRIAWKPVESATSYRLGFTHVLLEGSSRDARREFFDEVTEESFFLAPADLSREGSYHVSIEAHSSRQNMIASGSVTFHLRKP